MTESQPKGIYVADLLRCCPRMKIIYGVMDGDTNPWVYIQPQTCMFNQGKLVQISLAEPTSLGKKQVHTATVQCAGCDRESGMRNPAFKKKLTLDI